MGYELVETPIGFVGLAWTEAGLSAVQLPEKSRAATLAKLRERSPQAEAAQARPRWLERVAREIARHVSGEPQRFDDAPLDAAGVPPFHLEVYRAARAIAPGATATYGELAKALGKPGAARAVGQAMAKNRFPIVVPCHRVTAAGRKPGGFSAYGGLVTKDKLLALEGAPPLGAPSAAHAPLPYDAAAAARAIGRADPAMRGLVARVGPPRLALKESASTVAALAEAIVYQQLHGKAAKTIHDRLVAAMPRRRVTARALADADDATLRAAGLSRGKAAALRDLAARALAGEIPEMDALAAMDDEAVVRTLTAVRGIGRWTVEMLLVFRLGRPDVLPVADYGVRKGFAVLHGHDELPSPKELAEHGARWAPFRSVASWYLWRAAEGAAQG